MNNPSTSLQNMIRKLINKTFTLTKRVINSCLLKTPLNTKTNMILQHGLNEEQLSVLQKETLVFVLFVAWVIHNSLQPNMSTYCVFRYQLFCSCFKIRLHSPLDFTFLMNNMQTDFNWPVCHWAGLACFEGWRKTYRLF